MKALALHLTLLPALLAASASILNAGFIYSLAGSSDGRLETFDYSSPLMITSDTTISASFLADCVSPDGSCLSIGIYPSGLDNDAHLPEIAFTFEDLGLTETDFYYFDFGALSSLGTHPTVGLTNTGTLMITDSPEPSAFVLLAISVSVLMNRFLLRFASRLPGAFAACGWRWLAIKGGFPRRD